MSAPAPAPSQPTAPAATGVAGAPRSRLARGNVLLGFARRARDAEGRVRLRIQWARLGLALVATMLFAWLALATAAWSFVHFQRGVASVTFFDIALPFRWKEYQRKRGDDYIERAKTAWAAGQFRESFQMFRVGVLKSPANLDGRQRLAQIYGALGRPDLGLAVIEAGNSFAGDDLGYLKTYIALLFASQQDERVRQLATAGLEGLPIRAAKARILGVAAATACYYRGNYDEAEDLLNRYQLLSTKEGRLLLARSDWERGFPEIAIVRLQSLINEIPRDEDAYGLLFSYLRERKRNDEAAQTAVLRNITFPNSLGARIGLLFVYADKGERARVAREVESLLRDSHNDPRALAQVAEFAVVTADVALADQIRAAAESRGLPGEVGVMIALHARIAARNYADALALVESITAEKPDWLARQAAGIAGVQAIAHYGLGRNELGDLYLRQFLDQRTSRVEDLLVVASRLQAAGAIEASRRVLSQATSSDQLNQAALTGLVSLDLTADNIENLPQNIERLLGMRKPSVELLRRAYDRLCSDTLLFSSDRERVLPKLRLALETRPGGERR